MQRYSWSTTSSISPQPDTNITNKVVSSNSATASASGTDNEKTDGFYRREPLVLQPVVTQRGRQYMIDSPSPDQAPNGGSPPTATTDDAAQVSTNAESSAVEAELSAGPPAEIKQPSAGAFMILTGPSDCRTEDDSVARQRVSGA